MEGEAKTAKATAGAKAPVAKRSRPRAATDKRTVAQRLTDALAQQAATAEILRVMAASPNDVQPTLQAVAEQACRLCRSPFARIFLVEGDELRPAANYSVDGELSIPVHPVPLRRTSITGRATLDRITIHEADVVPLLETLYPDARENAIGSRIRSFLAVPLMREGSAYGVILLWRREPGLFAPDQVALVETFATQAAIAIANVRLFRATQEALEQQTATSEILRVISRSPTDVQPVFETIAANALRLCDADFSALFRFDGEHIHIGAFQNVDPQANAAFQSAYPCPPSRGGATQRAILTASIVHIPDINADPEYRYHTVAGNARFRSALSVPMLRDGAPVGTITVYRVIARPFPDAQIDLLKTFADQAVIAVENVRLFKELEVRNVDLTEALEQQTATSDILRVISQSPTDVQPVFDTIAAAALKLCAASSVNVFTFDGELIHMAALVNLNPEGAAAMRRLWPQPPNRGMAAGRAILTGTVVEIPDVLEDAEFAARDAAITGNFRSILAVPLKREGRPIGAIVVGRPDPGRFPDSQGTLLETFADQAVIAIENVRLFKELEVRNVDLTEALEQQTATSEILRVISQSQTDAQPVFDTIVRSVRALCNATFSGVYLLEGETLSLAAAEGMTPGELATFSAGYPRKIGPDTVSGLAALECRVVQTPDLISDPDFSAAPGSRVGARTVLGVPLMRGNRAIGSIGVWRAEVIPFSDAQIALLQTFADQAVIAIENVRLFRELETRNRDLTEALEQQTATSEILRVISQSQTDVQPVFDTIARAAQELCDATAANVFTYDGKLVHVAAMVNSNSDYVKALREFFPRPASNDTAVLRAILTRSVIAVPDVLADDKYVIGEHSASGGFRSVLAVPLIRDGQAIGGIAVGRAQPGPFPETHVALLQTFADQALIAIENVRLFKELEARTTDLTRSVGELKALGDVGQAVSSTLDLETVLSTIVTRATQLAGMDGGAIYEYDEGREEFYLHTVDRMPDDLVVALRAKPIRKGEGALGRMATTGEPVQIRDIMDERGYQSSVREKLLRLGYRALLVVPLLRDGRLLGGLSVSRSTPGNFDAQTIDLLKTFASQSALAIQNARLFREIEVKSRQLETASQHKSEFLANMSHELRTPLNAIIGFSEVLSERLFGDMNDKQAEYVRDITESGRHLLSLINEILDLSKIEAGRMELDIAEFDVATTIDNTISLVRERAQRRGIALQSKFDAAATTLHADERKVKQVLLNLLSNALKFTPEGGAIDVLTTATDKEVEIAVKDTGVGIAPDEQDSVFEEFRQVGSASKKIEGTGLGLAISRKFVELHGGRIWVTSQVGAGSTFAFTLPRRQ